MAEPIARGPGAGRGSVPWLTLGCALLLVSVYGLQLAYPAPGREAGLLLLGGNSPALVGDGEWFRLATANLLHASLLHVTINAISLMVIGAYLEGVLGRARLATLLLASAFAGSLASASLGGLRIAVGASTALAGLVGALLLVLVRERGALPRGWRLPGVLAAGLALAEFVLPEDPAVDSMAHLGGLAGGLLATALLLRGARPPAQPGRAGLAVLFALALAFALGVGQGALRVASGDRSALFRQAEFALLRSDASPVEINNMIFVLASQPDASVAMLELARERMSAWISEDPGLHPFLDTLAVVHYRLSEYDQAIAMARAAFAISEHPGYASRLVWLEGIRQERLGPLRIGPGSDLDVVFTADGSALELRFEPAPTAPTTLHVLLREAGALRGLVDLRLAPGVEGARVELPPAQAAPRSFALALLDTRPAGRDPGLRLLGYDPIMVPGLPPPVVADSPL